MSDQIGLFVTFEGRDGCGKTTQSRRAAQWLTDRGFAVAATREPGGTTLGAKIRQLLLHDEPMSARTEALLFAADRTHHVDRLIRPALNQGQIVLSDRYLDSSVAYQGCAGELDPAQVRQLSLWGTAHLLPDLTFIFDVTDQTAAMRLSHTPDRIEALGLEFQSRLSEGFRRIAEQEPARAILIDANGTADEVWLKVRHHLDALIEKRPPHTLWSDHN